jgi:putative transposase
MLQLLGKYGKRRRNRTGQKIHNISKTIVRHAKQNGLGIVMEDLKGIRKMYRKGSRQGKSFRGRMNSWSFYEVQRQIEYKALWEGIPVTYVNPRGTSRNCPYCGSRVVPLQERKLFCAACDKIWDRDVLASLNVMAASSVRADRSPKRSNGGNLNGRRR